MPPDLTWTEKVKQKFKVKDSQNVYSLNHWNYDQIQLTSSAHLNRNIDQDHIRIANLFSIKTKYIIQFI